MLVLVLAVTFVEFVGKGIAPKVVRERIAGGAQLVELATALRDQRILVRLGSIVGHLESLF